MLHIRKLFDIALYYLSGRWTKTWRVILFIFLFFLPDIGICTTYYISSSSGKDINSGTSPQLPWKTLGKIEKAIFRPGDSILLKRGDIWFENIFFSSSGTKENPIILSAYGEGAMPTFNGATHIDNWTLNAESVFISKYNGTCGGLLEDGKPIKRASSPSLTDGQWYFDQSYIFYRPAKGTPDDHYVERCARGTLITVKEKEYVIIDGIVFYGAISFGIRLIDCSNIIIRHCRVACNGQEGISIQRMRAELNCNNIIIHKNNIEWNANGVYITGKDGGYKSSGCQETQIIDNIITYTNHNNMWSHHTKDGHAVGIQNSSFCRIEGNEITENYTGIALWTSETYESNNNLFTRNFVARNHLYGIVHGADGKNNSNNNTFSFNIIVDNGQWPGKWGGLRINRRQEKRNYYYNNTLYNNDINIYLYSYPDFHVIKNNISINPSKYHVWLDDTAGRNNILDNNCYYSEQKSYFHARNSKDISFIEWKQRARQDARSIFENPLFKSNKPNIPDDYCLMNNSPCIGRATKEGLDLQKDWGSNNRALGACSE